MPSIISHAIGAFWLNKSLFSESWGSKLFWCVIISAMIPDADFIGYKLGIPYTSTFGHRGFSHSIFFALLWSSILLKTFFRNTDIQAIPSKAIWSILFLATISHPILDCFTSGGEGVALLSPFSNKRFFFPYRPIRVSPLGIRSFFSERGIIVILSEIKYIWIPSILVFLFSKYLHWAKG